MEAVWYAIVALMLTAWAVLDGFDFGAGIVQPLAARTEQERGQVLASIGPVWDGNEVWLIAAGGVFVFAFPHAYAVALSGMYLPLMLVLWLLILRGAAIELRGQVDDPLWRSAWDFVFALSSTVLAFVAGVALANVVRGVPIDDQGWFHLDLFSLGAEHPGALDGYTALVGALAVVVLAAHGASYVAWKTSGPLGGRAVVVARRAWLALLPVAAVATLATGLVRPALFASLAHRPWVWPLAALAAVAPPVALRSLGRGSGLRAFLASCALIAGLLLATAGALYPTLLPSTLGVGRDLDARAAASGQTGLASGLAWWIPSCALAVLYFVNVFRMARGKVAADASPH